ncbi:MAG: hypothetical protein ACREFO_15700 [Acetobacteraceae bacterium]
MEPMNGGERKGRAGRRMVDPDVRLVRLVMAGMPKEWLWLQPQELGLDRTGEGYQIAPASAEGREQMERLRIEAQRVALLLWWRTGRVAAVRTELLGAVQVMLRPIGRHARSDGRAR